MKQECNKDDQSGLKIENFLTETPHIVDKCHTIQLTEEEDMLPCETILEDTQNNHVVINEDLTTPLVTYKYTNDEMEDQGRTEPDENKTNLTEIDFNLEEIPHEESLVLKKRNDVYYEMYRDALSKAKMAKEMAITNYLEAKRIKNLYMLEDLSDNESDSDMESEYDFRENDKVNEK